MDINNILQNIDLNQLNLNEELNLSDENNNKLGEFIDNVNNYITTSGVDKPIQCDSQCQKDKKQTELYQKYITSRENEKNASTKLQDAEKSYYIYSKGDYEYNKMKQNEFYKIGEKMKNVIENKYLNLYNEINMQNKLLSQQKLYDKNIDALANTYSKEIKQLEQNIDNIETKTNIENRKNNYYNQYNTFFESSHNLFYWINIILTVAFISISIIAKKIYSKKYIIISSLLILNLYFPYKKVLEYVFL